MPSVLEVTGPVFSVALTELRIKAGVTGKRWRILAAVIAVSVDTVIQFTGAYPLTTKLTQNINIAAGTSLVLPFNPAGYGQAAAGQSLNLLVTPAGEVPTGIVIVQLIG